MTHCKTHPPLPLDWLSQMCVYDIVSFSNNSVHKNTLDTRGKSAIVNSWCRITKKTISRGRVE